MFRSNQYRLGLGTYRLAEKTLPTCLAALEIGYRHIDTAALYRNEAEVAEAIRQSGLERDEVFVTSKIWAGDIQKGRVAEAAEQNLRNLGRIDLLLLHGPTENLESAWESLCEFLEREEIGSVGVSYFKSSH